MNLLLMLSLLAVPPTAGLPECGDVASVFSHFTLVGVGGPEGKQYLAVRELYDSTEAGGGREAVDCGYDGLAALWDDSMRRTHSACQVHGTAETGAGRPGGVRLRFIPFTPSPGYTTVNAEEKTIDSPAAPVFNVYASAFDRKDCTTAASSKAALKSAHDFAEAHGVVMEGFKVFPLGNRAVSTGDCLANAKKPDCTQTLAVKLPGRGLTIKLELSTLPDLGDALTPHDGPLERWSFEVAPSAGTSAAKMYRVASTTFGGMVNGSSWTRLGPCELFSDGNVVVLKISLLHGFLGMAWEEARFIQLL